MIKFASFLSLGEILQKQYQNGRAWHLNEQMRFNEEWDVPGWNKADQAIAGSGQLEPPKLVLKVEGLQLYRQACLKNLSPPTWNFEVGRDLNYTGMPDCKAPPPTLSTSLGVQAGPTQLYS